MHLIISAQAGKAKRHWPDLRSPGDFVNLAVRHLREGTLPLGKPRPSGDNLSMGKSSPDRTIELLYISQSGETGIFCHSEKKKSAYYLFQEIACDIGGRGFAVQRLDTDELYHVRIGIPMECSCECLGFLRHGYCKHIVSLLVLTGFDLI